MKFSHINSNTSNTSNTLNNNSNEYYKLYIYLDPNILKSDYERIYNKYQNKVNLVQELFKKDIDKDIEKGLNFNIDAGFDLFLGTNFCIAGNTLGQIHNHGIKCVMKYGNKNTAFYLYPRSSMGAKTPIRLSNSVGIIDVGYRGHIKGIFDNLSASIYQGNYDDRLLQICGPNISFPIYPILVTNEQLLGETIRGEKGIGSTGK